MHRCRKRLRSNGGVIVDALLSVAAAASPGAAPPVAVGVPFVFAQPAPDAVVPPGPAKKRKRKREAMPPEYVKPLGKPGKLNPYWRRSFPNDEEDAEGRGKVVEGLPGYGIWRRVPGFWKILASDLGYIMTEGDSCVRTPTVNVAHYLKVQCNGRHELVHLLVCRAFHGRPTPDQVSVDHKDRDEANNSKDNLDWATLEQQRRNQGDHKAKSNGEPCLVWEVVGRAGGNQKSAAYMTPVENTEQRFPSKTAAAEALGLNHGALSDILNGKCKTVPGADGKRYTGKWDSDLVDLEGEEWKEKAKSTGHRLLMSNYGRLQRIYPGGRKGTKHYPESSDKEGYLMVQIDGKNTHVHILVGELFFIGPKPRNWRMWDHKDRDKQNNHIGNLRPVTVEVNNINTDRQRDFYIWPKDDPDQWERCVSQSATARAYGLDPRTLNAVLHKRLNRHGNVRTTVGGYCAAFCDEVEER
jgi:hypothetical protein